MKQRHTKVQTGLRPDDNLVQDDLDFLKNYTPEQVKKIWDECKPKNIPPIGSVIITGTIGNTKKQK